MPKEFQYKDEKDNYYYGSSGEFSTDFVNAKITDIKMLLSDGSRIVGKSAYKTDKQDQLNKITYQTTDNCGQRYHDPREIHLPKNACISS